MSRLNDTAATMNGEPEPLLPSYVTAGELLAEHPDLREPIIDGLLRRGETLNVIASPKMGKSWLVLLLLLSLAAGRMLLGIFPARRCRVLLIDNELHAETLASRIGVVARAMGLLRDDYAASLAVEAMRGKGATLDRLLDYARRIGPGVFDVVVLDAWYRALPPGIEENSNDGITHCYNLLDEIAGALDAAIVVIHHTSKGNQSEKSVTDVGSGAGAQSRAADAHLVIRQHEEDDAVVVDAVARSFAPPKPFGMRWAWPLWRADDTLDVTMLRRAGKRREKPAETSATPDPVVEPWTADRFVGACVTSEPRPSDVLIAIGADAIGSERKAKRLLKLAEALGLIFKWPKIGRGPDRFATREPDLVTDLEAVK